jgi:hypothetical protein
MWRTVDVKLDSFELLRILLLTLNLEYFMFTIDV